MAQTLVPLGTTPRLFIANQFNTKLNRLRAVLESDDFIADYQMTPIGFEPGKTKLILTIDNYGGFTLQELEASSEPIPPKQYTKRTTTLYRKSIDSVVTYGHYVRPTIGLTDPSEVTALLLARAILQTTGKLIEPDDIQILTVNLANVADYEVAFRIRQQSFDYYGNGFVVLSQDASTIVSTQNTQIDSGNANGFGYAGGTFTYDSVNYNGCIAQVNVSDVKKGVIGFTNGSTNLTGGFYQGQNPLDRRRRGLFFQRSGGNLVFTDNQNKHVATFPYTTGQPIQWEYANEHVRLIYGTKVINFAIQLGGLKAGVVYTKGTNSATTSVFLIGPRLLNTPTPTYIRLMEVFNRKIDSLEVPSEMLSIESISESTRNTAGEITRGRVVGTFMPSNRPVSMPDGVASVTKLTTRRIEVFRYNPVSEQQLPVNVNGSLGLAMPDGTLAINVTPAQIVAALLSLYNFAVEESDFIFTPAMGSLGYLEWATLCPTYFGTVTVDATAPAVTVPMEK